MSDSIPNSTILMNPSTMDESKLYRHQHSDGSVETAVGIEQAIRLCPELGRIAAKSPEQANALLELNNIQIPGLDIDKLLIEKDQREDKLIEKTTDNKDEVSTVKLHNKNTLNDLVTYSEEISVAEITENRLKNKALFLSHVNASITKNELKNNIVSQNQKNNDDLIFNPKENSNKRIYLFEEKQESIDEVLVIAKKPVNESIEITNSIDEIEPIEQEYSSELENTEHAPEIQIQNFEVEFNETDDNIFQHSYVEDINLHSELEKTSEIETEETIEYTSEIDKFVEDIDLIEHDETVGNIEIITETYVEETYQLFKYSDTFNSEFIDKSDDLVSPFEYLQSSIDHTEDPRPISLDEIKNLSSMQTLEQSLAQILDVSDRDTPEFMQISDLLTEISEKLTYLSNHTNERLKINKEVTKDLLNLLILLGFNDPKETLASLINRHNLEFLIQSIHYLSQILNQDNQQETIVQQKSILVLNINPIISSIIGKLSLRLVVV